MNREILQVEKLAAQEAFRLLKRDHKTYTRLISGLYIAGIMKGVGIDDARLARAGYFYARHIDDALDGENSTYPDKTASPEELPVEVIRLDESSHRIARLGRHAINGLVGRQRDGDSPVGDMQRLIDSMVFDYQRKRSADLLIDEDHMTSYFDDAMRGTNLMLIGFHSVLREDEDIPNFSRGLGRIYSARDFADDWSSGIINAPRDVLVHILGEDVSSGLPGTEQMLGNGEFLDWQLDQLRIAETEISRSLSIVKPISGSDPGAKVINLIGNQALGYIPDIEQRLVA